MAMSKKDYLATARALASAYRTALESSDSWYYEVLADAFQEVVDELGVAFGLGNPNFDQNLWDVHCRRLFGIQYEAHAAMMLHDAHGGEADNGHPGVVADLNRALVRGGRPRLAVK